MATVNGNVERIRAAMATRLHSHWRLFLIEGIILLILGTIAIVAPLMATIAIELIVGWVIIFSGVAGLIMTFKTRGTPGFFWSLVSAVIGIAAGLVLLIWPLSGVLSLTLVLTAFLVFEGVASIMYALAHRHGETPRWGFMLFSGMVDLLLAGLIFWGFPGSATWVLGLIVGINMILGGWTLMIMALHARTGTTLDELQKSKA